jgi:hypothetical protein
LGAGYFIYIEMGAISSALEEAMGVIAEIQNLLPKLEVAVDTINNLDEVFQNLSGISEILSLLLDPLQSNS